MSIISYLNNTAVNHYKSINNSKRVKRPYFYCHCEKCHILMCSHQNNKITFVAMSSLQLIKSMVSLKCPKCRQGDLFVFKGLFRYSHILDMPEHCEVCAQKYEIEPGFWIGALWTSYPIVIAIEVPFLLMALLSTTVSPWVSFGFMLLAFLVFYPIMLRLGRSIWIHISVRFDERGFGG